MPTYDGIGETITHEIEVVGDVFISNVEGGSLSTQVPFEIFSNVYGMATPPTDSRQVRLRVQPSAVASPDDSYVTDMGIQNTTDNYFFITAPQNTSTVGDQNTFVISSTSNVGIGTTNPEKPLHVVGNAWITGTLTASNIVGASPVTISSDLVIASGYTLTAAAIEPPSGVESNLNITGTITASNITHGTELTVSSNLLIGSDKTLTTSNITHETELTVTSNLLMGSDKTLTTSNITHETELTLTSNLLMGSDKTLTTSNITHESELTVTSNLLIGSDKTLTTSNIETSNLTVSNRLSGGTISVSNIEATANLVVGGPVNITGTLSSAGITSSADVNVTGTITTSNIVAHANENLLISSNLEVGTSNLFVNTANGRVGIGITEPTEKLHVVGNIFASGTISVNPNTDSKHTLGNAVVGYQGTYTGFAGLCHYDRQGVGDYAIMQNSSGRTLVNASTDEPIEFRINNSTKMILESDGNVGIGQANPVQKLDIYSSDNAYLKITGNSDRAGIILSEDGSHNFILEYDGRGSGDDNYVAFYSGITGWASLGQGLNYVPDTGYVGIGTASPDVPLHIVDRSSITTPSEVLRLQKGDGSGDIYSTTRGHIGMHLRDSNAGGGEVARISWGHDGGNTSPEGLGRLGFWTSNTGGAEGVPEERMTIRASGDIGIGVDDPTCKIDFGQTVQNRIISLWRGSTGSSSSTDYYGFGVNASTLRYNVDTSSALHRFYGGNTQFGYVNNGTGFVNTFTGQHKSFPHYSLLVKNIKDIIGLIVSASGEHISINDNIPKKGQDAIQISESIPTVKLSTKEKDKAVFGVVSDVEDEDTERKDHNGSFVSVFEKESGDNRIYVNSLGEGAVWVVNTNGILQNGDYITTSNVAGYGQKQDSEFLANYTVAKITMDCDFNPPQQPVQIILKDEEGNNILDQYGQLQWINDPSGAMEAAYKVKELDGGILAAFVGCTYHCG